MTSATQIFKCHMRPTRCCTFAWLLKRGCHFNSCGSKAKEQPRRKTTQSGVGDKRPEASKTLQLCLLCLLTGSLQDQPRRKALLSSGLRSM
jgi:hypothetical protein